MVFGLWLVAHRESHWFDAVLLLPATGISFYCTYFNSSCVLPCRSIYDACGAYAAPYCLSICGLSLVLLHLFLNHSPENFVALLLPGIHVWYRLCTAKSVELRVAQGCNRFSPNEKVAYTKQGIFACIWSTAFRNRIARCFRKYLVSIEPSENTISLAPVMPLPPRKQALKNDRISAQTLVFFLRYLR